jgi:TATA-box binding protein (TBP) (component of TFIID and TFIIIB)
MEQPTLSTMVVLYNTNLKVDTTKLLDCLPINETIIKVEKRGLPKRGESKKDKIKHRVKKDDKVHKNTGFGHNSITLVMMNDGDGTLPKKEITIKIFQNGVFHLTGVLNDQYDICSMRILLDILWNSCRDALKDIPEKYEITSRRVVLMNYTTRLKNTTNIAREALYVAIRNGKYENTKCHYDPDVYPGVKIHIGPQKWTAKVFRTGKIILTGITDHNECEKFIEELLSLFELVLPPVHTK